MTGPSGLVVLCLMHLGQTRASDSHRIVFYTRMGGGGGHGTEHRRTHLGHSLK